MLISFARQLIVLLPVAYLLSRTGVLANIWWAFPIAEVMAVLVALALFLRLYRSTIRSLPEDGEPLSQPE